MSLENGARAGEVDRLRREATRQWDKAARISRGAVDGNPDLVALYADLFSGHTSADPAKRRAFYLFLASKAEAAKNGKSTQEAKRVLQDLLDDTTSPTPISY